MRFKVGSVPYVNAKPLIHRWERGEGEVGIVEQVPSALPGLLDSGVVDAILVSSFEVLQTEGRAFADGVSIATEGEVQSVRLFSKVAFRGIETLALDQSSMTSNNLAQFLLAERHHVHPFCRPEPPSLEEMLAKYDACVLIGDIGMMANSDGLHVMDLGLEWTTHTQLPFVWALWVGLSGLNPELVSLLQQERDWGLANIEEVSRIAAIQAGWPVPTALDYLSNTISFGFGRKHLESLKLFQENLHLLGLLRDRKPLSMISASTAVV